MKNYVQFYNGNIHNEETKRPALNSSCYKCDSNWNYNKNNVYTLVNILVNGGKHDTYVLRNNKTGKISNSCKIATIIEVAITDYSEKIKANVTDENGIIDFQELRKQLETCGIKTIRSALNLFDLAKSGNIQAAYELFDYMFNNDMTGKMTGMVAIGTSCKLNPHCKLNQLIDGSICQSCYAENMRKTTAYKQALCTLVLCTYVFTLDQIPYVNAAKLRFESFADLLNDVQVINYINIATKNSHVNCAIWTKRPALLHKVLMNEFKGIKPGNLSVVVSSLYVNSVLDIKGKYLLNNGVDMVNHVFTVFTAKYAIENNINIQCGKSKCIICGICYSVETDYYVNEILKEEQKDYYAMLACQE